MNTIHGGHCQTCGDIDPDTDSDGYTECCMGLFIYTDERRECNPNECHHD
jgi:hypothetical protein